MLKVRTLNYGLVKKTINLTSTPEPLSDDHINTYEFEVFFATANTAVMHLGNSNVNSDWIPRSAGTGLNYEVTDIPGEPRAFDLSQFYVYGTSGDIIIIQYRNKD